MNSAYLDTPTNTSSSPASDLPAQPHLTRPIISPLGKTLKLRKILPIILGIFALLLILGGSVAAFFLTQNSQDLRQQASGTNNCCGVDGRVCTTPAEWDAGYYACLSGQCSACSGGGEACGNGICNGAKGENCNTCGADCGACGGGGGSSPQPSAGGGGQCTYNADQAQTQRKDCGTDGCYWNQQKLCQSSGTWGPCVNSFKCGYQGAGYGVACSLDNHCQSPLVCRTASGASDKKCLCPSGKTYINGQCTTSGEGTPGVVCSSQTDGVYTFATEADCKGQGGYESCSKHATLNCWKGTSSGAALACNSNCNSNSDCRTNYCASGKCSCALTGQTCNAGQCVGSISTPTSCGSGGTCKAASECVSSNGIISTNATCGSQICCLPQGGDETKCSNSSASSCINKRPNDGCADDGICSGSPGSACVCKKVVEKCDNGALKGESRSCSGKDQKVCVSGSQYENKKCQDGWLCSGGACVRDTVVACSNCKVWIFEKGICRQVEKSEAEALGLKGYEVVTNCRTENMCYLDGAGLGRIMYGQRVCSLTENAVLTCVSPVSSGQSQFSKTTCNAGSVCGLRAGQLECVPSNRCSSSSLDPCKGAMFDSVCQSSGGTYQGTCLPGYASANTCQCTPTASSFGCTPNKLAPQTGCTRYMYTDNSCKEVRYEYMQKISPQSLDKQTCDSLVTPPGFTVVCQGACMTGFVCSPTKYEAYDPSCSLGKRCCDSVPQAIQPLKCADGTPGECSSEFEPEEGRVCDFGYAPMTDMTCKSPRPGIRCCSLY